MMQSPMNQVPFISFPHYLAYILYIPKLLSIMRLLPIILSTIELSKQGGKNIKHKNKLKGDQGFPQ